MNHLQIAKVVHAAVAALDETLGSAPQEKWEGLTDQEREDKVHALRTDVARPSDPGWPLHENDRLKIHVAQGINQAFERHEESLKGPLNVDEAMIQADKNIAEANQQQPQEEHHDR